MTRSRRYPTGLPFRERLDNDLLPRRETDPVPRPLHQPRPPEPVPHCACSLHYGPLSLLMLVEHASVAGKATYEVESGDHQRL
eukprot:2546689-Rhodomonas_salina.2